MENKIEKQNTSPSTKEPRRAVKLNVETLRALEGEVPSPPENPGITYFPCTPNCPW